MVEDIRTVDGHLIISAITGLIEEPDNSEDLITEVDSWPDGLSSANVWDRLKDGDTLVARYGEPNRMDETYEVFGDTPVAVSPVSVRVFGINGEVQDTLYFLRGESVDDDHRIEVVRKALGLAS